MGRPPIDISGQRFGRLLVRSRAVGSSTKNARWFCLCDCGNLIEARSQHLRDGAIRSCGCLAAEDASKRLSAYRTTHGLSRSSEYRAWQAMRSRCENHNNTKYEYYGGRGISVCNEWNSFEKFIADMGMKPTPKHTLERKNPNLNYCPDNCYWATRLVQANNTRRTCYVSYRGKIMPLADAARMAGMVSPKVAWQRIRNGWDAKSAVEIPLADWAIS